MLKTFTSPCLISFAVRRWPIAFAIFSSALALPMAVAADETGNSAAPQETTNANDSLANVRDQMQQAQSMLAARDASGRASAAQQEVVSELDAMIAKLQKQCESCGGQCNKPPGPQNKRPKPGNKSGAKPGETSAMARTKPAVVDRVAIADLVKDLWGRLPERQREELMQPLSEEFLPEYAAEIEEYFRVLAESPAEAPAETRP